MLVTYFRAFTAGGQHEVTMFKPTHTKSVQLIGAQSIASALITWTFLLAILQKNIRDSDIYDHYSQPKLGRPVSSGMPTSSSTTWPRPQVEQQQIQQMELDAHSAAREVPETTRTCHHKYQDKADHMHSLAAPELLTWWLSMH